MKRRVVFVHLIQLRASSENEKLYSGRKDMHERKTGKRTVASSLVDLGKEIDLSSKAN